MHANQDTELLHKYRYTHYNCSQTIEQSDGVLRTKFCGYAWCSVCGAIKCSRYIDSYKPLVAQWQLWFLTLTAKSVTKDQLPERLQLMHNIFKKIVRQLTAKYGKGWFKGIRKIEITHNRTKDTYHPHYHVLIDGREQSEEFRRRWLSMFAKTFGSSIDRSGRVVCSEALPEHQVNKRADPNTLTEMFKYVTKLTKGENQFIDFVALDWIFTCLSGKHPVTRYGFELTAEQEAELDNESIEDAGIVATGRPINERATYQYNPIAEHWFDVKTGRKITDLLPDREPKTRKLVLKKVVKVSELTL